VSRPAKKQVQYPFRTPRYGFGITLKTFFPQSVKLKSMAQNPERPLDFFFAPKAIAVIGATEKAGSAGRTILWNLISSPFGGAVYPVNSKRQNVLGIKAYPSISQVPDQVDLAVIITPAATVAAVVRECGRCGVKGAIVISAGFREIGAAGAELERAVMEEARKTGIRLIGPNCLGLMRPVTGLNATFAGSAALPGNVGFLSQSGAMCTAVLDWSLRKRVGFSAFISTGSMIDVNWGALIDYLGEDPHTKSIVIYMESVVDARSFLSAAREVAPHKPIIVIKAGRSEQAAKAAASHTGTLAGSDGVLDAAFRRCGVLRVSGISEVFDMVDVLARQPRPRGPKLLIVTNAGGPGVLATDELFLGGGALAELSEKTMAELNASLPSHWSHGNPIDTIGDADAERYAKAIEAGIHEPDADGLLAIMTPQGMTDPTAIAERLKPYAQGTGMPILASWMGGAGVATGEDILNRAGIPTFSYPDDAVRTFLQMWKYDYNLRALYETPSLVEEPGAATEVAAQLLGAVRAEGRTLLTEAEAKQVLKAYGIPVIETWTAASADEAAELAERSGFPVAVKLNSRTITHKSDVGGVKLNLGSAQSVREAFEQIRESLELKAGPGHFHGVTVQRMAPSGGYELIIGCSSDAQFGPVLLFGTGGQLVEVFQDRALGIPPLNTTLARRMMEQTKIYKALQGVRGRKPVDLAAIERLLVRIGQLVLEQKWIKELDINPLLATDSEIVALDARIALHEEGADIPIPAIRPYPSQYVQNDSLTDGAAVLIRPIRPDDEPDMAKFHTTLSEHSVFMRYFEFLKYDVRTAHERLARLCFVDYDRHIAFVAVVAGAIVGVGRLIKTPNTDEAEAAFVVADTMQKRGLGNKLLEAVVRFAREEGIGTVKAVFLPENQPMRKLLTRAGFLITDNIEDRQVEAVLTTNGANS
jgi:acetyltransferase